jgi:hypothetical protein
MEEAMPNANLSAEIEPKAEDYAPYHLYREFNEGYADYLYGSSTCPYNGNSVAGQAWDRGMEYAMRLKRWTEANPAAT